MADIVMRWHIFHDLDVACTDLCWILSVGALQEVRLFERPLILFGKAGVLSFAEDSGPNFGKKTISQASTMACRDTSLSTPPMGSVLFQNLLRCRAPL